MKRKRNRHSKVALSNFRRKLEAMVPSRSAQDFPAFVAGFLGGGGAEVIQAMSDLNTVDNTIDVAEIAKVIGRDEADVRLLLEVMLVLRNKRRIIFEM